MNHTLLTITRILGFVVTLCIWRVIQFSKFSRSGAIEVLIVPLLLVFPTTWIGRRTLDDKPPVERLVWITSFVHMLLMIFFGVSIIEAIRFFQLSPGPKLPIPVEVSAI